MHLHAGRQQGDSDVKQGLIGENERRGDGVSRRVEREIHTLLSHGAAGGIGGFKTLCSKLRPCQLLHTQLLSVSLVSAPLGEHLDNQSPWHTALLYCVKQAQPSALHTD